MNPAVLPALRARTLSVELAPTWRLAPEVSVASLPTVVSVWLITSALAWTKPSDTKP